MYCGNCGSKNENNKYCTNCGHELEKTNNQNIDLNIKEINIYKIISIVLGVLGIAGASVIVFSPISLVLSIVGLIIAVIGSRKSKNVLGIILNAIGTILSVISIIIVSMLIRVAIIGINNLINEISSYNYSENYNINDFFDNFFNIDEYKNNEYDKYY